jgi:hypothetical protein
MEEIMVTPPLCSLTSKVYFTVEKDTCLQRRQGIFTFLTIFDSLQYTGKPVEVIDLNGYKVHKFKTNEFCKRQNAFVLVPSAGLQYYVLQADSEKEMEDWFQSIREVTQSFSIDLKLLRLKELNRLLLLLLETSNDTAQCR